MEEDIILEEQQPEGFVEGGREAPEEAQAPAEEAPAPSKRDAHISRLKAKTPDFDPADDEALFSRIGDDYDEYESQINSYRDNSRKLTDLFDSDPRSATIVAEMARGGDPVIGLIRHYGPEIRDILDNPDMQQQIAEANKEYVQKVAKEKELEEEYRANLDTTLDYLEQLQQERGLSDQDVDAAMEFLIGIVQDGVMGKFSPESIDLALKAVNYDSDMAAATEQGEIAGRNARIEERLRSRKDGDGTSPLPGGAQQRPRDNANSSIFDVARDAY